MAQLNIENIELKDQIDEKKEKEYNINTKYPSNLIDYNISNDKNKDLNQIDINREEFYKNLIIELEKEIEKEKNKSKDKTIENKSIISDLKVKLLEYQREIKYFSIKNEKQREELELLSIEVTNIINRMNIKDISKNLEKYKNSKYYSKEIINRKMDEKEKQLKSIIKIIQNSEIENESLKNKLSKINNAKKYNDLKELQKEQEKTILELQKEIKIKKTQLEGHSKCETIKSKIIKKIEEIRNEIRLYNEKYENSNNKIKILEYKSKIKPKIIKDNKNNKTISTSRNNQSINLKLSNETDNQINKQIYKLKYKKKEYPTQKEIDNNEKNEDLIDIPLNVSEIFNENELKAIFIGLDKNKIKYKNTLKMLNIKSTFIDTLETKHKYELKKKLNIINELDEKITYTNVQNGENEADIELYQKQINELNEEKKLYSIKNNKLNAQIKEKKIINEEKDKEINNLGNQLIQMKQNLKNGEIISIKNFPKLEIQYIDENEDKSLIKNIMEKI